MTPQPTTSDVEQLRAWLVRRTGLWFDDRKLERVGEALARRLGQTGRSCEAYLADLAREPTARREVAELATELTVNETYFFRNADQLRALADVIRDRARSTDAARPLRILSAGCSSGEEPYSLAIVALEAAGPTLPSSFVIDAFDLDPEMLKKAAEARYSSWSLRATSAAVRARWFRETPRGFVLDPAVTRMVRFSEGNLADDALPLWRPASLDVVFCRNVLMYFSPAEARAAIGRIARSLVPGGLLFLGHAETLRGLSDDFELRQASGAFYYERLPASPRRATPPRAPEATLAPAPRTAPAPDTPGWMESIQRAADRIEALTRPTALVAPDDREPSPSWDLSVAIEHVRHERWADARAELDGLPPASAHAADVLLLRAVLSTHGGDLAAAEVACSELIALDGLDPGPHYLMALCREAAGDRDGAVEHHRAAVALDALFALPHLHLGLLARRAGDDATARRELEQAIDLLRHEDELRLVLFGGGFDRDALGQLCRAELSAARRAT